MNYEFFNINFLNPWYFLLFLIVPIFLYLYYKKSKKGLKFQFLSDLKRIFYFNSWRYYCKFILIFLIFVFFILLLANPNKINVSEKIEKNGIDIVLVLDISDSMLAQDFTPNRIEWAKKVISEFIKKQKTNRVWLVVFAWKPFTSIPLTFDYNILEETVKRLSTEMINQQKLWWTAIWDAILSANNLFDTEKKDREKVVILLTDWDANVWVSPLASAISAKDENIKIYTIWIWSEKWWYITYDVWPFKQKAKISPLNDKTLKEIAKITSWKYFRATDDETLENIFDNLESLDKKDLEIEIKKNYKELYQIFAYILSFLIFMFIVISEKFTFRKK